jgi:hypothetical protein
MKFRPQVQLRFRDEVQYLELKTAAKAIDISLNEFILRKLENGQATTQQRRAMAVADEGNAAQKTCAYEPPEGKQKGREVETLNLPESQQASISGPGQAEARRPSARHGAATHRNLAQSARPDGLSAPSGKSKKFTADEFFALKPTEQLRAKREGKF